jgi:hypothetical protein
VLNQPEPADRRAGAYELGTVVGTTTTLASPPAGGAPDRSSNAREGMSSWELAWGEQGKGDLLVVGVDQEQKGVVGQPLTEWVSVRNSLTVEVAGHRTRVAPCPIFVIHLLAIWTQPGDVGARGRRHRINTARLCLRPGRTTRNCSPSVIGRAQRVRRARPHIHPSQTLTHDHRRAGLNPGPGLEAILAYTQWVVSRCETTDSRQDDRRTATVIHVASYLSRWR